MQNYSMTPYKEEQILIFRGPEVEIGKVVK